MTDRRPFTEPFTEKKAVHRETMMTTKQLRPDFERMMINWAKWSLPGGGGIASVNSIYLLAGESRSRFVCQATVPVLALEAEKVDRALNDLPMKLGYAVSRKWKSSLSIAQIADQCECCEKTFYNRVERGHEELGAKLHRAVWLPAPELRSGQQVTCGLIFSVG